MDATIIWDLEDDSGGNVQHLREHDVTMEEAEEVLLNPQSSRAVSRASGLPTAFGWTSTGRYLAVVYALVDEDPLTLRPIRAYDVPPPASKKKRRKRCRASAFFALTGKRPKSALGRKPSAKNSKRKNHRWKI